MPEPASARLTRHRSFVLFWCARTFSNGAFMMQGVAVGWQIYDLTNDPLDLGLVGLMQFFPLIALALVIGQVADRCDRRLVAAVSQVGKALAALMLAIGTFEGWLGRDAMLGVLLFSGTARAFEMPTMHAMVSGIVPPLLLPRAIAASATAQQTAVICGPSIGGLLYAFGPTTVYAICTAVFLAASVLISLVHLTARNDPPKPVSLDNLFAGFRYIRHNPVVLGAISLDLFAVLLGGVTALLADLCARYPGGRAVGARAVAVFAGAGRADPVGRAGAPGDRGTGGDDHVRRRRDVRACEHRVCALHLDRHLVSRADDLWRGRRGQCGDPAVAHSIAHAL